MTAERGKYGITFTCNQCGDATESATRNFGQAVQDLKDEGWQVQNINGEWFHFCGTSHKDKFNKERNDARGF